jgi:hypothetical protein
MSFHDPRAGLEDHLPCAVFESQNDFSGAAWESVSVLVEQRHFDVLPSREIKSDEPDINIAAVRQQCALTTPQIAGRNGRSDET